MTICEDPKLTGRSKTLARSLAAQASYPTSRLLLTWWPPLVGASNRHSKVRPKRQVLVVWASTTHRWAGRFYTSFTTNRFKSRQSCLLRICGRWRRWRINTCQTQNKSQANTTCRHLIKSKAKKLCRFWHRFRTSFTEKSSNPNLCRFSRNRQVQKFTARMPIAWTTR